MSTILAQPNAMYWKKRTTVQTILEKGGFRNVEVLLPDKLKKDQYSRVIIVAQNATTAELIKDLFNESDISEAYINKHRSFCLSLEKIIPTEISPSLLSATSPRASRDQGDSSLPIQIESMKVVECLEEVHSIKGFIGVFKKNQSQLSERSATFTYFSQEEMNEAKIFFSSLGFIVHTENPCKLQFNLQTPAGFTLDNFSKENFTKSFLDRNISEKLFLEKTNVLKLVLWEIIHRFSGVFRVEGVVGSSNRSTRFVVTNLRPEKIKDALRFIHERYNIQSSIDPNEPKTFFVELPWTLPETSNPSPSVIVQNESKIHTPLIHKKMKFSKKKLTEVRDEVKLFLKNLEYKLSKHVISYPINTAKGYVGIHCRSRESSEELRTTLSKMENVLVALEDDTKVIHLSPLPEFFALTKVSQSTTQDIPKNDKRLLAGRSEINQQIYDILGDKFARYISEPTKRDPNMVYLKLSKLASNTHTEINFLGGKNKNARIKKATLAFDLLKKAGMNVQTTGGVTIKVFPIDKNSSVVRKKVTTSSKSVEDSFRAQLIHLFTPAGQKILFGEGYKIEELIEKISEHFVFIHKGSPFIELLNEKAFAGLSEVLKTVK